MAISRLLYKGLSNLEKGSQTRLKSSEQPKVSILISIRNEEITLPATLDALKMQDYPAEQLELVLINDRSTDSTLELLKSFKSNSLFSVHIETITHTPEGYSPKKYALSQGFPFCTGDIIVSTDADCRFNEHWISSLIESFTPEVGMVVGMTTYYSNTHMSQLLWGMESLEFFSHAVVAASMISNSFPINTNANNMAYRKTAYLETSKVKNYDHVVSGDDDFLLQEMHALNTWEIIYAVAPESQVQTKPSPTLKAIWEQRKRWGSKTTHYGFKQIAFLSYVYGYYVSIFVFTLLGIFNPILGLVGLASWAFKSWFDFQVMKKASYIFSKKELMNWFIPTALLQVIVIVFAIPFGVFGTFTWKDNKTKNTV